MSDSEYSSGEDEDYVPEAESGSEEEPVEEDGEAKPKNKPKAQERKKRKGGIKLDDDAEVDDDDDEEEDIDAAEAEERARKKKEKEEAEKKARMNDLWSSFKKDTQSVRPKSTAVTKNTRPLPSCTAGSGNTSTKQASQSTAASKVTVTRTYDFAGEAVTITKTVDADSSEAKLAQKEKEEAPTSSANNPLTKQPSSTIPSGAKRKGGLGSLLGQIGKKPKISTLDKSKLDWDSFKAEEGIGDELKNFNKDGYLEKQDFLQRTDVRLFEREKAVRDGIRRK